MTLVIRGAEVDGLIVDVRLRGEHVVDVDRRLRPEAGEDILEATGGALIPGLHDHHIHLLALAAAGRSTRLGPPEVADAGAFRRALETADRSLPGRCWIRGTAYHESVAGDLDRDRLDAVVALRPVRVQHRGGALWILNSAGLDRAGIDATGVAGATEAGVERDGTGRPTGRLFGLDTWLRGRLPSEAPDLGAVGRQLLGYGVTGVTDATPVTEAGDLAPLAAAVEDGRIPQRVVVTGAGALPGDAWPGLERGPVKLVVADHALPRVGDLASAISHAHDMHRTVAVHCVTRVALLVALAAWDEVGAKPGDRVEHGAVVGGREAARLATLGLTVVTQPSLVAERGDRYLVDVEPADRRPLRAPRPVAGRDRRRHPPHRFRHGRRSRRTYLAGTGARPVSDTSGGARRSTPHDPAGARRRPLPPQRGPARSAAGPVVGADLGRRPGRGRPLLTALKIAGSGVLLVICRELPGSDSGQTP